MCFLSDDVGCHTKPADNAPHSPAFSLFMNQIFMNQITACLKYRPRVWQQTPPGAPAGPQLLVIKELRGCRWYSLPTSTILLGLYTFCTTPQILQAFFRTPWFFMDFKKFAFHLFFLSDAQESILLSILFLYEDCLLNFTSSSLGEPALDRLLFFLHIFALLLFGDDF